MEQKRVDYICFISWYNKGGGRGGSLFQRGEEEGQFQKVGSSLARHPSPEQQLQGSGIIDFKGINSQPQIVPFQGIICNLCGSHKAAGTGGLTQNSFK